MQDLNELVKMYKVSKDKKLIEQIFIMLKKVIDKKAEYTYYQRRFKIGKKYIRLSENNQIALEDVKQELYLDILRYIDRYDTSKLFDTYLFSSIWNWKPSFITNELANQSKNVSIYKVDDEGNEDNLIEHIATFNEIDNQIDIDDLFDGLTEQEKILLNILKENSTIKQSELAEKLEVTQQYVSLLYESIRKKYKE